jgi:hypothetical protein
LQASVQILGIEIDACAVALIPDLRVAKAILREQPADAARQRIETGVSIPGEMS